MDLITELRLDYDEDGQYGIESGRYGILRLKSACELSVRHFRHKYWEWSPHYFYFTTGLKYQDR